MPTIFKFKLFFVCVLGGFWGVEGLDKKLSVAGCRLSVDEKALGLKAPAPSEMQRRVIFSIPLWAASRRPDCARWYYSPGFPKQWKSMPRQQKEIA